MSSGVFEPIRCHDGGDRLANLNRGIRIPCLRLAEKFRRVMRRGIFLSVERHSSIDNRAAVRSFSAAAVSRGNDSPIFGGAAETVEHAPRGQRNLADRLFSFALVA